MPARASQIVLLQSRETAGTEATLIRRYKTVHAPWKKNCVFMGRQTTKERLSN